MRQIVRHPQADAEWEAILAYWVHQNGSIQYALQLDARLETPLHLLAEQSSVGKATPAQGIELLCSIPAAPFTVLAKPNWMYSRYGILAEIRRAPPTPLN